MTPPPHLNYRGHLYCRNGLSKTAGSPPPADATKVVAIPTARMLGHTIHAAIERLGRRPEQPTEAPRGAEEEAVARGHHEPS